MVKCDVRPPWRLLREPGDGQETSDLLMPPGPRGTLSMNSCSQCGTQNPRWATRCSACGAQLLHEEHQEHPAAEARKIVTVVCCSVRNFDELSERLDPEALAQMTDAFFEDMCQALERYGATVEQWGNEKILGLFGIPQVHADDALRAVYASFEMRTSLNHQNSEFFRIW